MSRYYETQEQTCAGDSRAANRIVLPEFIPFNSNSSDNESLAKDKVFSSPAVSSKHETSRSREYRNPDHPTESHRHSNLTENGKNNMRPASRDSYRSPPQSSKTRSPKYSHISRDRSRSLSRSPKKDRREIVYDVYDRDKQQEAYQRGSDRHSTDRNRHNGSSVFDRMSSPPTQKRKYGETSRRSVESSHSNGQNPHFFRTLNGATSSGLPAHHRNYNETSEMYQSIDPSAVRVPRARSPYDNPRRCEAENIRNYPAGPSTRQIIAEENADIRNLRERLISAESHCSGLEATVRSYEREILKLRSIVNLLIDDFASLQNRLR